ncbi:MAG: DUF4139 domain-containing protein [Terriglobia bacterium]|nr:DUF4139 domain-containing protein [Terriglobia bacterium]
MSKRIGLLLILSVLRMLQLPVKAQEKQEVPSAGLGQALRLRATPSRSAQDDTGSGSQVQNVRPSEPPAITIYNANFAVVREMLPLDLGPGVNAVRFGGITAHVEPDSVMLRDPLATRQVQIWEQNYRNDPVTQELLLSLYKGQTITFKTGRGGDQEYVKGKVIRAGYVPRMTGYSDAYVQASSTPIIEVDGQLQFSLPGQPMFPSLIGDTVLKPSMNWLVQTDKPGKLDAELSYVTGGLSWEADYNLVAPEKGDTIDLVGWVTIQNHSGTVFDNARIKLMAGDVNKIQPTRGVVGGIVAEMKTADVAMAAPVTEKSFDEFHLYSLARPTTLHDQETKQVEFVAATGVKSTRFYLYDGSRDTQYGYYWQVGNDPNYGTQSNPKVAVMQEFVNSEANHLGIPLPKGRLRFYRRDSDGHLEFTGENTIDHTPKDETIRVYTGNAFDITGERKRTDFHVDSGQRWLDETYQIKVRNHKKETVTVRVLEHLYRWNNWKLTAQSDQYRKLDSRNIEFRVQVPPDGEKVVTYTVHYWW